MSDFLPGLPRLRTLETWLAVSLDRVRQQIADAERQGQERRPIPPDWVMELGIGVGAPPTEVHAGDRYEIGRRRRSDQP
ncbi:hypothetical protein ACFWOJ_39645 [Streptomyces sp. NPDC058439]|uniref:hypothetical protein n=1 Tax=Streptomyces sp. NPDC058439 TaxID=3346500 RepID=UPI0036547700